jgi:hypothetical protein
MITISWNRERTVTTPEGGDEILDDLGELSFDVLETETYDVSATVTSLVVETGAPITDHIRPNQDREVLVGIVSNSPLRISSTASYSDVSLPSGGVASVLSYHGSETRTAGAFEKLRALCRDGVLVDVEGGRRVIEGWAIESISAPREVDSAGALVCTVSLVEIQTAEFEEIDVPSPRVERGRRSKDRGRERAADTGDESSTPAGPRQRASALSQLGGALQDYGASR